MSEAGRGVAVPPERRCWSSAAATRSCSSSGPRGWHFPAGRGRPLHRPLPEGLAEAIEQLEALRAAGAGYLLVPATSAWWLEHYEDFGRHLARRYDWLASVRGHGPGVPPDGETVGPLAADHGQDEGPVRPPQPPRARPGGTEAYTLRVFEALRARRVGARCSWPGRPPSRRRTDGTARSGRRRRRRASTWSGPRRSDYDKFFMTAPEKRYLHRALDRVPAGAPTRRRALPAHAVPRRRPDLDRAPRCSRTSPILYTLHEYLPICNHYGQLVRTQRRSCARRRRRGAATSASRRSAAAVLPARALHPVALRPCRPVPRAEPVPDASATSTGESRAMRIGFEDHGLPGRARPRTGAGRRRATGSRSSALLNALQGHRRAVATRCACSARDWDGHLTHPRRQLRGAARRSRRRSTRCSPRRRRATSLRRPATTTPTSRSLMAEIDWVVVPSMLVGELAARDPGGLPARAAR